MTIQDAMLSYKPFKREVDRDDEWLLVGYNGYFIFELGGRLASVTTNDILADDWEIKE